MAAERVPKEEGQPPVVQYPQVILFGDSLTQQSFGADRGWGALIADSLQRKCDVLNRGFSGYNSKKCLALLPFLFHHTDFYSSVAAVVVTLGTNDCSAGDTNVSHVPIEKFEHNMAQIGQYFLSRQLHPSKLILCAPPPYYAPAWEEKAACMGISDHIRTNDLAQRYGDVVIQVAKRLQCRYVPTHLRMMAEDNWATFLADGVHFSERGAGFFFSLLDPHLKQLTYDIPLLLPLWRDYDERDDDATNGVLHWTRNNPLYLK